MIYLELFYTFFKIGLFTFGGGYAMIPMIESEVTSKGWATMENIIDFIAVSESTPGPFAVNISTFIGKTVAGNAGAVVSTFGVILPSFIVILCIAKFFANFKDNYYVKSAMEGIRPAALGLIANAGLSIGAVALFSSLSLSSMVIDYRAVGIFLVVFLISQLKKKTHPVFLVLVSMLMGIFLYGIVGV